MERPPPDFEGGCLTGGAAEVVVGTLEGAAEVEGAEGEVEGVNGTRF